MFEIYNTYDETYYMVYGVSRNNNGEALFLIYFEDEWKWVHSEHFKPSHF
jgi:hypothetical protein